MNERKMKKVKKAVSALLALVMLVGLAPVGALAAPEQGKNWVVGGDFSDSTPWDDTAALVEAKMNGSAAGWSALTGQGTYNYGKNAYFIIEADGGMDNSACLTILRDDSGAEYDIAALYSRAGDAPEVGTTLVVTYWAKVSDTSVGTSCILGVDSKNAGFESKTAVHQFSQANVWEKVSYEITLKKEPAARTGIYLRIVADDIGANQSLSIDNVSIREPLAATGVQLDRTAITVNAMETEALTATLLPEGANSVIVWSSSDPAVATVDPNGVVTAVDQGVAVITASSGSGSAACTVTVQGYSQLPTLAFADSFENVVPNENQGVASAGSSKVWNGARPVGWSFSVSGDGGVVDGLCSDAQDGSNCVKITATEGRILLSYTFSKEQYAQLRDKAQYRLSAWVKGENCTVDAVLRPLVLVSGNTAIDVQVETDGQWQYIETVFSMDKSSENSRGSFGINVGFSSAGSGVLYVDDLTLERIWDPAKVAFEQENYYMDMGGSITVSAQLIPGDSVSDIRYTSSDISVATVDENGVVMAHKPGTVTVTARTTAGNKVDTCTVHVVENYVPMTDFSLPASMGLTLGGSQSLSVTYAPADATRLPTAWVSDAPDIVCVDAAGNITGIRPGTANITATIGGISRTCAVTVTEDADYQPKTAEFTVDFGSTNQWDLQSVLPGVSYAVLHNQNAGRAELDGSLLTYVPYVWLDSPATTMVKPEQFAQFLADSFEDQLVIGVVDAAGKTSTVTLNITISSMQSLFYDEQGSWITDFEMFITEEKLEYIRSRVTDHSSTYYQQLQLLMSWGNSNMETLLPVYNKPIYSEVKTSYDGNLVAVGENTMNWLMLYLYTKDVPVYKTLNKMYLEQTIKWATALLQYPFWGTLGYQNSDRAAGANLMAAAMVYYYLKDELKDLTVDQLMGTDGSSEEAYHNTVKTYENQPFLQALELRLWTAGEDMFEARVGGKNYMGNHQHIQMGGLIAAATALRAQENLTEEQQSALMLWIATAVSKIGYALNFQIPDGTSQEGLDYWRYGSEWILRGSTVAEMSLGIDLFAMTRAYENSAAFVLHNLTAEEYWGTLNSLAFGDNTAATGPDTEAQLRFIAAEYQDGIAQWLADRLLASRLSKTDVWMAIAFLDDSVAAEEPSLEETIHLFEDLQILVSRTDWSGQEQILGFKCGLPQGQFAKEVINSGEFTGSFDAGHAHPDAGHITLYANGEYLFWEDYNTDKAASNHNVLLINGTGQLGEAGYINEDLYLDLDADPYIKLVQSTNAYDYIVGDATGAYDSALGLALYERNLVWLKDEQVLLVVDNVQLTQQAQLSIRWLPAYDNIYYTQGKYVAVGEKNVLNLRAFTQETVTKLADLTVTKEMHRNGFLQTYTGSEWQNAVALSWDLNEAWDALETDPDYGTIVADPAIVRYLRGEGSIHYFEVNGKVYAIDAAANTVTVTESQLDLPVVDGGADSSLSSLKLAGSVLEGFDPAVTEYTVERWWSVRDYAVEAYATVQGAAVEISEARPCPGTVTITCTSADGSSTTTYTINITNPQNILDVVGAYSNLGVSQEKMVLTYDGYLSTNNEQGKYWTVATTEDNPTLKVIFDLGVLSEVNRFDMAILSSRDRSHVYNVEISNDGVNWQSYITEAVSLATRPIIEANTYWRTIFEGEAVQTRYIRVELLGYGDMLREVGYNYGIAEVVFYGTQLEEYPDYSQKPDDTQPTAPVDPTEPGQPPVQQPQKKASVVLIVVCAVAAVGIAMAVVWRAVIKPKKRK